MQQPETEIPDPHILGSHWSLGWILMDWSGRRLYGHDGSTLGQGAFLRVLPDAGLSVSLMCNGGHMRELYEDLYSEVFSELAGVELPPRLAPAADPGEIDAAAYAGHYVREGVDMTVEPDGDGLLVVMKPVGALAESMGQQEPTKLTLRRVEGDTFVAREKPDDEWASAVFYDVPGGGRYLHFGVRATPRVES